MTTKRYTLNPKYSLTIGWLYPELMSTYGDRGNIIVLQKRCEWRGINVKIERINQTTNHQSLATCDLLFMGGAQDIQQEMVNKDLIENKGGKLFEMIEDNTPALFICGAYQFLGKYYKDAYGIKIKGLGVFDMYTESSPNKPRLIGNIVVKANSKLQMPYGKVDMNKEAKSFKLKALSYFVGFENHGGRTYLSNPDQAFAKVIKGFGNNGEDATEGIHYKSSIGTYMHGPILPCNPELADYLIESALIKKYGKEARLKELDDAFSEKAKLNILKRLKTSY